MDDRITLSQLTLSQLTVPDAGGDTRDRFGRVKRKLRISLTDRCNFRCPYCMPVEPDFMPKSQQLTRTELRRLLHLFVSELGMTQLRLTGGEPLLRRDLEAIIAECGNLRAVGLQRISMTTNGFLLAKRARSLKSAGIDDLNVSLDGLTPETFAALSGGRESAPVLAGIEAAVKADLPLKLNTVVVRGVNDHELLPLARWALIRRLPLRFIEFMPLDGRGGWSKERVFNEAAIIETLSHEFTVTKLERDNSPATTYLLDGHFPIGIISTVSNPFCSSCDRLRITADGMLYPCLFSATGPSLRDAMRHGATDTEVLATIRKAVWFKDAGYVSHPGYVKRPITMHTLGG